MSVDQLIQDIYAATADGVVGAITSEDRARLLAASDALRLAYEDPMATVYRMMFAAHQQVALRLAIGMKIIDAAAELNEPVNVDQLALHTNGDSTLIKRIIRVLAAMNIFKELEPGRFTLTSLGKGFVTPSPFAQAVIHFSHNTEAVVGIPKFMAKHGYKNPEDPLNVPYQSVFHTDLHGFDHMKTIDVEQNAFNTVISFSRKMRGQNWFDVFPVKEKLQVDNPSKTLVVDVGGGLGHDLIAFKKQYPDLSGVLITQDIPEVIDSIKDLPSGIEAMKQDFFAPQPVKAAKLYFLRNVLHDWPDKRCKEILKRLRDAMDSASILLIQESEMPEFNAPFMSACMDLSMMALFAGGERTRTEFRELLDSSGLELVETWTSQSPTAGGFGTLYEAVRKQ